jgi:hypothetical protein
MAQFGRCFLVWSSVANKPSIGLIRLRLIDWIVN